MQFRFIGRPAAFAAAMCIAAVVHAAPISSLFSTGLDGAGDPLAGGASDVHYTVLETGTAAQVRTGNSGLYFPNSADSQWIWENAAGIPTNVTRTFRTTFDLTGFDHTTAAISGLWGTDNEGLDILLNGVSLLDLGSPDFRLLSNSIPHFSMLNPFTIEAGFQSGLNTLDFIVRDNGGQAAFRAEFVSATADAGDAAAIAEPATLALLGVALTGLVRLRRRRRN